MKNDDCDDGFTLVTRKSRSGRSQKLPAELLAGRDCTNRTYVTSLPREAVLRQIEKCGREIQSSKFFSAATRTLDRSLDSIGHSGVHEILCYGLGRFSTCVTARYQLGLLLSLKHRYRCKVLAYDPLFCRLETSLLAELGCELIALNEEGKRKLTPEVATLVFAPHCPKQLTNNLLWANWEPNLQNCVLLGNSLRKVLLNPTCLPQSAEYILRVSPHTAERALANNFRFKDVFNDLAFHVFDLGAVTPELWHVSPHPPVYPENDTGVLIKGHVN